MPSVKVHKRISKDRTGFDFEKLHKWVDDDPNDLGYDHRIKRHSYNVKEENEIKNYWNKIKGNGWGEKAVVEWLFHIAIDNLSTAFKKSFKAYNKNRVDNFLRVGFDPKSTYIFYDFDKLDEHQLEKEFNDVYGKKGFSWKDLLNAFR